MGELVDAWNAIISKYKELNAPLFKEKGDVGKFAKEYDTAHDARDTAIEDRKNLSTIFDAAQKDVAVLDKKVDDLKSDLDSVIDQSQKDLAAVRSQVSDDPEGWIKYYTNLVSIQKGYDKEKRENWEQSLKFLDQRVTRLGKALDDFTKQYAAANAKIKKIEADMARLANSIRQTVAYQSSVAEKMNRGSDLGKAARSFPENIKV